MRRSSKDRVFTVPVEVRCPEQPLELEQIADEAIQILAEQLVNVTRERDGLLAAAVRAVETKDSGTWWERDDALEALRAAIID